MPISCVPCVLCTFNCESFSFSLSQFTRQTIVSFNRYKCKLSVNVYIQRHNSKSQNHWILFFFFVCFAIYIGLNHQYKRASNSKIMDKNVDGVNFVIICTYRRGEEKKRKTVTKIRWTENATTLFFFRGEINQHPLLSLHLLSFEKVSHHSHWTLTICIPAERKMGTNDVHIKWMNDWNILR